MSGETQQLEVLLATVEGTSQPLKVHPSPQRTDEEGWCREPEEAVLEVAPNRTVGSMGRTVQWPAADLVLTKSITVVALRPEGVTKP